MTWTHNSTWSLDLRSATYILRRPAGKAYVWQAKTGWWLGRIKWADGTTRWLSSRADRRHVQWQAEALLGEAQPETVSA